LSEFRQDEVLLALERAQARMKEVLLALSERRREQIERPLYTKQIEARLKVLSASRGEEMYALGKLRHQKKSFSPQSELRQDELKGQGCS